MRQHEVEEEEKTILLGSALRTCYGLRMAQGKYNDALVSTEEAYNIVAIFYNPVHPKVQLAANALIECLMFKGDLDPAETFTQITLDSLKDSKSGLDQQSEEVAHRFIYHTYVHENAKTFISM
jgi:ATP/maltotriose-dependent transcriptional regulator MalT